MKKIKEGEEFEMAGTVFMYTKNPDNSIQLKIVRKQSKKTTSKKEFVPPTLDEVKDFFKEKEYTQDSAQRAYDYYTAMGWADSSGKPVINWKGKMIAVWFKPENKIKKDQPAQGFKFFQ